MCRRYANYLPAETAHGYTAFLLKYRVLGTPATAEEYQAWEAELGRGSGHVPRGGVGAVV